MKRVMGHAKCKNDIVIYSHIFPDSWAQHCNFDTLLAGSLLPINIAISAITTILGLASTHIIATSQNTGIM